MSWSFPFSAVLAVGGAALLVLASAPKQAPKAKPSDGAKVFAQQCQSCHGANGKGGPGYTKSLTGSKSAVELAKYIRTSMPPSGKKCSSPDAEKVAAWMFDAFYSPIAQDRNRPARVELARLTVRQFRNAVADLVGDFRPVTPASPPNGLSGEYFKSRDLNGSQRVVQRIDPTVKFDFGTDGPVPGKFDPHTFSALWQGSVLAPDTGDYEFIVRTDHALTLRVNGEKPVIDAWVKSGSNTEFKASIHLLGGRAYPIRLEFSKATQGVDDTEQKKGKPAPPAFISLNWRRPGRTEEVIPTRNLFSENVPPTFVVDVPFPADDRSIGYERGNSVSKEWDDATTSAALETAGYITDNLQRISGINDQDKDRPAKLAELCRKFVQRAFRRPLSKESEQLYITKQFAASPNVETAVKRVVILTLKSPRFLYPELSPGTLDSYDVATQLSMGLWDSLPDAELERAASAGQLATPEQISKQAERMANDPRAWNKLRDFLLRWLKVDEVPEIVKSAKRYPEFDASTASELRTSLEIFLEKTAWSPESDYRELLLSKTNYLNGKLAKVYGANLPPDAPFTAVTLDSDQRAGVLTSPYLLSRFAYLDNTSPIHRGVLIVRSMLGRVLAPPPAAFVPLPASSHPDLTTRQRVALQTKPEMCNACHGMINPLGFTLERFDAIGKLRTAENGKPIDSTGAYISRSGETVKFAGAPDLAKYIANSDEAHAAFIEKLFQHLVKQPVLAYGPKMMPRLQRSFAENRYSIRKLMVEILTATAQGPARKVNP